MRTEKQVRQRVMASKKFKPENRDEAIAIAHEISILNWMLGDQDWTCDDCKHDQAKKGKRKHLRVLN